MITLTQNELDEIIEFLENKHRHLSNESEDHLQLALRLRDLVKKKGGG